MNNAQNESRSRIFRSLCILLFLSNSLLAQLEIKSNPFAAVNQSPGITIEMLVHDKIGLEASCMFPYGAHIVNDYDEMKKDVYSMSGQHLRFDAKYYFNPSTKGDRFYTSAFVNSEITNYEGDLEFFLENRNFKQTSLELGIATGYKWIGWERLILQCNVGVGTYLSNKTDYIKLNALDVDHGSGWNVLLNFNVGYRFNKKKVVDLEEN